MTRWLLLSLVLLAGCSGSLVGTLPSVPDPSHAATVVVIRPSSVFGVARTLTITIDGQETYDIASGEHVAIPIAPGPRLVGLRVWDLVTVRTTARIQAEPGRTYFFLVGPGSPLTELTETEARPRMVETVAIGDNAWQGRGWSERVPGR